MPISVHTEISDEEAVASGRPISYVAAAPYRGWILYDGECQFCRNWVRRTRPILGRRGFAFAPLQSSWVRASFRPSQDELLVEMRVLFRAGKWFGGADAIFELAKYVWWAWPLVALAQIPGMRQPLRAAYRQIATRRSCRSGTCSLRPNLSVRIHPQVREASRNEIL